MAALAPWDHPSCALTNVGFRTCQEVLSHASVSMGMVIIIALCTSDAPGVSRLLHASHGPYQSPSRPGLGISYSFRGKAVSLRLCDHRKGSSGPTPDLDCLLCLPSDQELSPVLFI